MAMARDSATESEAQHTGHARRDWLVVTVPEAAALLGISRGLAYELAARGELPVVGLGRRIVVPRRALLDLVGEDGSPSPAPPATTAFGVPATVGYRLLAEPVE